MNSQELHDRNVNELFEHPEHRLGLEGVVWKSKEVPLYNLGYLAYVADLVFIEHNKLLVPRWIVVEYKLSEAHKDRAMTQLRTARYWFNEHLGEEPELIFCHGSNFEVESVNARNYNGGR